MKNTSDPATHRAREQRFVEHVMSLLRNPQLRIDTSQGSLAVAGLHVDYARRDRATDMKRLMGEMNRPDRDLQIRMPVGEVLDVWVRKRRMLVFRKLVGQLRAVCVSPARSLVAGESPDPMNGASVKQALRELPPPLPGVPLTTVLLSTSGFSVDAHEEAQRTSSGVVLLVEPNDGGGWTVHGPPEMRALAELFDPEAEQEKRKRVRSFIEQHKVELLTSGLATDRLAAKASLPLQLVESELRSYARENPGFAAKRLDGRVVLFREGSAPASAGQGGSMPFIDKIKSIFKGENEKKISLLSEQKAQLSQQLDRAYEDIGTLEKRDASLREEFKAATGEMTKRRLTSQLLQLRKDIERRQQLVSVLGQRINVVGTHLHNLELVKQGVTIKQLDSDEIAQDAAAAEEALAQLQADNELADSVANTTISMSQEEQALFEELEREAGRGKAEPEKQPQSQARAEAPRAVQREAAPPAVEPQKRRADAEPG